ncbi:hypothetical protein LX97_02298 [Nonlabens dokdonensis]|uniref:Uncharacterized protein n=3 Tax=Nonlabens dokdonensis TaxID=328515 RepID=L7WC55_NONDD|nr:hypothetical protein DDD_2379 [Nonlabens dokdonensis DSW-6]PZX39938.1 hypothetical protein LX97_02298 [Nonlabens dokdonensis]
MNESIKQIQMKNILKSLFILSMLAITSCYYEDIDDLEKRQEVIEQDTTLYDYVESMAQDGADQDDVTCIKFVYPIGLYTVDENDVVISLDVIVGNQAFFDFLNNLNPTDNISISYPIETTLSDGTIVSVTNNDELLDSIESCIERQEEIIRECDGLLNGGQDCIWKVGYSFNDTNDFLGAEFDGDGITYFEYGDDSDEGSWNSLFIEDQLFININLLDDTSIYGQRFNKNWRVESWSPETMTLTTDNGDELIINRYCSPDDTNDCFNLDFIACENDLTPGIADIILDDYTACIFEIMRLDESLDTIAYYENENDALTSSNAIDSSVIYNNTSLMQDFYVGITYGVNGATNVIEISISVENCP